MITLPISQFLRTDFRDFALYDVEISVPSMIDGLKISQRKAMWTAINNQKTMTVEQLASLAASYTKYHHGATNLEDVISKMARNYTGSNNVNWLFPDGHFGNILDHKPSSPRYISTYLSPNWVKWFPKEHAINMEFVYEDGDATEPKFFIPLVPVILFNGASGIGTGYATDIFGYNPDDVLANVKNVLAKKRLDPLIPWFNGYKGKITKNGNQTIFTGAFVKESPTTLRIIQVPIGYDAESYKQVLNSLVESGEIKKYDAESSDAGWDILITGTRAWCALPDEVLIDKLKLVTKDTENIVVWDENHKIRTFSNPNELIEHFVQWRLGMFESFRLKQIEIYTEELRWLNEKRRFIEFFIANSKEIVNLSKTDMIAMLNENGFVDTDRLIQIRIYNLTRDEVDALDQQINDLNGKKSYLESATAIELYKAELKKIK